MYAGTYIQASSKLPVQVYAVAVARAAQAGQLEGKVPSKRSFGRVWWDLHIRGDLP